MNPVSLLPHLVQTNQTHINHLNNCPTHHTHTTHTHHTHTHIQTKYIERIEAFNYKAWCSVVDRRINGVVKEDKRFTEDV